MGTERKDYNHDTTVLRRASGWRRRRRRRRRSEGGCRRASLPHYDWQYAKTT